MLHRTTPAADCTPFRAAAAAALCSPAIEAACAQELMAAKQGTKQAKLELIAALNGYLDQASEYVAVPFEEALLVVRGIAPVLYAVYPTPESAEKGVGRVYRRLFAGDSVLALSADEARIFFFFVRDVLAATAQGVLRHNRVLAPADEGLAEHAPYLTAAVSALTTHDAKSAHSSAGFCGCFITEQQPSRFLSAQAFPAFLSGRTGGGLLRDSSWLEFLLPFSVSIEGGRPVSLVDVLLTAAGRKVVEAHGVTAFDGLPLIVPSQPEFDHKMLARVRVKVSDTESVALNLMPANSMLKASVALAERIEQLALHKRAARVRELALAGLAETDWARFDVQAFVPCLQLKTRAAASKALLTSLIEVRKDAGLAVLKEIPKVPAEEFRAMRSKILRSPVVGSNPNNCGGAFLAFCGKAGPYRFPAATHQAPPSAVALRRFYGALTSDLADKLGWLKARIEEKGDPLDKYKVGSKFLPVRSQKKHLDKHVDAAARAYLTVLTQLRQKYLLSEQELLAIFKEEGSPIQRFVIDGAQTAAAELEALARQGLCVINVNDSYAAERFVTQVVKGLKGDWV